MTHKFIDDLIRENAGRLDLPVLSRLFRECTPKLLVVTDGLNYSANSDFGRRCTHKVPEPMAREVTRVGVQRYLDDARGQVREIDALLGEMCR